MRRRLEIYIPIVMLALLVQLFAPIGAFRAVAQAASDPLYMGAICSEMASEHGPMAPQAPVSRMDCCSICTIGLGGSLAINPPPLIFVKLQRAFQKVSWLEATDPTAMVRVGSNAQARAPPAIS